MAYRTPPENTPAATPEGRRHERIARRETPRGYMLMGGVVAATVLIVFLIAWLV